ncbi:OFA family MFS transporter [Prosthecobacter sp.]|uniref:OFA family MFS transporter n=1 Tax=Prosthecobacter sp. TaxID=1965333 RepID=UPI002ABBCBCB|nr:OFA family MFS transporter [Prosthecobacter sp.]MDZ4406132.1 OFA family MFS transporter [Prosthecobacter sp.]
MSFLSREATIAKPGFSRWLVPPAAVAVHMCIGQVYAFSVFNKPLSAELGATVSQVNWAYMIALMMLGISAAVFGKWVERSGPRKTMLASCCCFCGGLLLAALGVKLKILWLILFGYGFIGGIGLGLGYISPVSTLVKWFPDRPGMATGMAIMGFGGGALIGSPLAQELMKLFTAGADATAGAALSFDQRLFASLIAPLKEPLNALASGTSSGAMQALITMAGIYACFMLFGAFIIRVPAPGWKPEGYEPKVAASHGMITTASVSVDTAWKTPQFWLLWTVLCMNVSAGIGVLGRAADMCMDMFGVGVAIGAGFTGLLSIFNMGGRFVWSSTSDLIGRKAVYCVYFILGAVLYAILPYTQETQNRTLFVICTALIISMYGGGFATIPAYLKDMFGTYQVGAIHGRLITAWSMAAVIGPSLINGFYDSRVAAGVPKAQAYNGTFYLMCGLLGVGLIANLLVRPVDPKYHVKEMPLA